MLPQKNADAEVPLGALSAELEHRGAGHAAPRNALWPRRPGAQHSRQCQPEEPDPRGARGQAQGCLHALAPQH
eukprot:904609-Rhodomonas_salina.1